MTVFIRLGLGFLILDQLVVGVWNAIWPESFYRDFPTVDLTPPFSEHYARDFGGATLGIGLFLVIGFLKTKAHFVIPATLAFLIYAVPHFFYHVANLEGATVGEAIALTSANAFVVLLGISIILVTIARDRSLVQGRTGAVPGQTPAAE